MLLYVILGSVFLTGGILTILMFKWSGDIKEGIYDLILQAKSMQDDMESMKLSLRAIADTTAETAEVVAQMRREKEAAETPDEEAARRAKEEIDRFNAGIANILSFGTDERDGGKK